LPSSSWVSWHPRRFEWTAPFHSETKTSLCAIAITFRTSYTRFKWSSASVIDFKKACESVRREVFSLGCYSHETVKANKNMSEWNLYQSPSMQAFVWHVFYKEWFETRRCFIVIAFQLCFRVCH
jgi:hypothetical protein